MRFRILQEDLDFYKPKSQRLENYATWVSEELKTTFTNEN